MIRFILSQSKELVTSAKIITDGNSLTQGTAANTGGKSYPTLLNEYGVANNRNWTVVNDGSNSDTLTNMINSYPSRIRTLKSLTLRNIIFLWEGTNDIYFGKTVQQAFDNYVTYTQLALADGFEVMWINTLPRDQSRQNGDSSVVYQQMLKDLNDMLSQHWQSNGVSWYIDTRLAPELSTVNPTYYGDSVHLNELGYEVLRNLIVDKI